MAGSFAVGGPALVGLGLLVSGLGKLIAAGRVLTGLALKTPLGAIAGIGVAMAANWKEVSPAWDNAAKAGSRLADAMGSLGGVNVPRWSLGGLLDGFDLAVACGAARFLDDVADGLERLASALDRLREGRTGIDKELQGLLGSQFDLNFRDSPVGRALHGDGSGAERDGDAPRPGGLWQDFRSLLGRADRTAEIADGAPGARGGPSVPLVPSRGRTGPALIIERPTGLPPWMAQTPAQLLRDLEPSKGPNSLREALDITGTVDAELKGRGKVDVTIKVEGGGRVSDMRARDEGHLELDVGTTINDMSAP